MKPGFSSAYISISLPSGRHSSSIQHVGDRARLLLSLHPQTALWGKNWREGLCQDKGTRAFSLDFAPRRACAACAGREDGGATS